MTGVISRTIATRGAVAYQDREDPEVFEYFPTAVPGIMGESLQAFACQYYGIGAKAQWVQTGPGTYANIAGGLVSGRAKFDATATQKKDLTAAISKTFGIKVPRLRPIQVAETSVQALFAGGLLEIDIGETHLFPRQLRVGEAFNFSVSSGNSLFPQLVASLNRNRDPVIAMGLVLAGKLVLYGAPFTARVTADLTRVWHYVRSHLNLCASSGWYRLEGELSEIVRGLRQAGILQVEVISGGNPQERELESLSAARAVFDALNNRVLAGPLLFRFSPRHDRDGGLATAVGYIAEAAPWSVDVNLTIPADAFDRPQPFDEEMPLQGEVMVEARSAMDLGVACSNKTKEMFFDVTLGRFECITAKKLAAFQERVAREVAARNAKIEEYERRLLAGDIDLETYEKLVAMLNNRTLSERDPRDRRRPEDVAAEIERIAALPPRRRAEYDRETPSQYRGRAGGFRPIGAGRRSPQRS